LEALRNDLGLTDVRFAGFVPQQEKALYYLLCDLFILPSITLKVPEEWGLVVNEAMSVGKPVIVTDSVGCAYELVKNNVNGLIVPEKDIEALSSAAIRLLSDDEARARMGKESKRTIDEGFTYQHSIDDLSKFVRSVLSRGS
jgi:glycosyltransferase involved in cell wall biosynthesis